MQVWRAEKTNFMIERYIRHADDFVKASFVGLMRVSVDQIAGPWFLMGRKLLRFNDG